SLRRMDDPENRRQEKDDAQGNGNRTKNDTIQQRRHNAKPEPSIGIIGSLRWWCVSHGGSPNRDRTNAPPHPTAPALAKCSLGGILCATFRAKHCVFGHIPDYTTPATGLQTDFAAC